MELELLLCNMSNISSINSPWLTFFVTWRARATLDVGGVEITLANASIETIIAISFILGFYNDESRRLLDSLRERITTGIKDTNAPQKDSVETP